MIRLLASLLITSLCALAAAWVPPVGIPYPPFGITNSHWMYHPDLGSKTWNYGSGAVPYRTNEYGPYVYYVDKNHPSATDTANTYGTPTTPRLTWPYPLAAGAVVQATGATYWASNIGGNGTASDPIFIVGVGDSKPIYAHGNIGELSYVVGDWFTIEGFEFTNNVSLTVRPNLLGSPCTNICVRSNLFSGTGTERSSDVCVTAANWGSSATEWTQNFVVFRNTMMNYGNWTNATENDSTAAIFGQYATNIWFMENTVTHMGGDMIRIGANEANQLDNCLGAYMYVGRNTCYANGENAVDVKKAYRAVVSENVFHDFHQYVPTGGATAISIHYYPNYIWFINNTVYDGIIGFNTGSEMQATNQLWLVGNVLYDFSDSGAYWRSINTNLMFGNTIYDAENGVRITTSGSGPCLIMTNNIVMDSATYAITFPNSGTRSVSTIGYENYYMTGGGNLISWSSTYTTVGAWIAAVTTGDNSVDGDPLFVNAAGGDFRIGAAGAATGTGSSANWSFIEAQFLAQFGFALNYHDLNGVTRDNDIGAYEYSSTARKATMSGKSVFGGKGRM